MSRRKGPKKQQSKRTRDGYLKRTYGINQDVYERMLDQGGGKCWICEKPPKPGKNLAVDHDHKTGQVRGLLDWHCNKYMVGRRRREHAWMYTKTAAYLASTKDWRDEVEAKDKTQGY
jgi:hypothetical protein